MTCVYSRDAKLRLAGLGQVEISDFIDSISPQSRQACLSKLPTAQGFRKGSALEQKERTKRFLNTLTHVEDPKFRLDGIEWVVLGNLWVCWARENFGEAFSVSDVPPGDYSSESTRKYFEDLVSRAGQDGCSREEVERLYAFSGFSSFEEVSNLIAGLPPKEVVEQRKKQARLPEEVRELRERVNGLDHELKSLHSVSDATSEELSESKKNITKTVGELEKRLISLKSSVDEVVSKQAPKLDVLESNIGFLKKEIEAHEGKIALILSRRKAVEDENTRLVGTVTKLEKKVEEFSKEIEKKLEGVVTPSMPGASVQESRREAQGSPRILQKCAPSLEAPTAKTIQSAVSRAAANIASVGVHATDAEDVALVAVAAAISGQLVLVTGSFATILSMAICESLSGSDYWEWQVPIGLCDGEQTEAVLEALRSSSKSKQHCLHISGINRSAFEIFGDSLRQIILLRQLGFDAEREHFLVASVADGPATLPASAQLQSLGPLIDTEKLTWGRARFEKRQPTILQASAIRSALAADVDSDELQELARDLERISEPLNQLRKRILHSTASQLLGLTSGNWQKAFQLGAAFWGIPWAKIHGVPKESICSQLHKLCPGCEDTPTIAKGIAELVEEPVS